MQTRAQCTGRRVRASQKQALRGPPATLIPETGHGPRRLRSGRASLRRVRTGRGDASRPVQPGDQACGRTGGRRNPERTAARLGAETYRRMDRADLEGR